jgi:hypothetical protein
LLFLLLPQDPKASPSTWEMILKAEDFRRRSFGDLDKNKDGFVDAAVSARNPIFAKYIISIFLGIPALAWRCLARDLWVVMFGFRVGVGSFGDLDNNKDGFVDAAASACNSPFPFHVFSIYVGFPAIAWRCIVQVLSVLLFLVWGGQQGIAVWRRGQGRLRGRSGV